MRGAIAAICRRLSETLELPMAEALQVVQQKPTSMKPVPSLLGLQLPAHPQQRHVCWVHLIHVLNAIAERTGASGEFEVELQVLQHQLFGQW